MHRRTLREVSPDWLLTLLAIGTVLGDFAILYPRANPSLVTHALGFIATNLIAVELLVQVYWTQTVSVIAPCAAGFFVAFFGSVLRGTAISDNTDLETQRAWFWGIALFTLFLSGVGMLLIGCDAPRPGTDEEEAVGLDTASAAEGGDPEDSTDVLELSADGTHAKGSLLDQLHAKSGAHASAPPGYEAVPTASSS
ncbi:hypothetical protein JCM10213_005343 [Rhodosporidiobolus nylandii]